MTAARPPARKETSQPSAATGPAPSTGAEGPLPALRDWLDKVNRAAAAGGLPAITPATARAALAAMTRNFVTTAPTIGWVEEAAVGGAQPVPVRVYDPEPSAAKAVCLFIHGGGHVAGSIDVYDPVARRLAHATGRLVVSVDYRLAPEHPYPAGLNDCLAVARDPWQMLSALGRPVERRLAVVGDSGGGALAATVSALARGDAALRVEAQALIYPSLDYTLAHRSVTSNGQGYLLETSRIRWYFDQYLAPGTDRRAISPLHMGFAGLPPTLVVSAGFCPLRDEAQAYIAGLAANGVTHRHLAMPRLIHAYLNLEDLVPAACAETYAAIAGFLDDVPDGLNAAG